MKVYNKIMKMGPITVLSTAVFLSPGTTFAAENTQVKNPTTIAQKANVAPQGRVIQGYLFKNGVKTPVYKEDVKTLDTQTDAPYPELSPNPNDPIPATGATSTEYGSGSVLYLSKVTLPTMMYGGLGSDTVKENIYFARNDDGSIEMGSYDPKTLARTKMINFAYATDADAENPIYLSGAYLASKYMYNNNFQVQRDTVYTNIGSGITPRSGSYTFSQAITSGLSTTDIIGGSLTLGFKYTLKEGGGVVPAESSQEFSTQLTASYSHNITVTSQVTNTQTLSNPKAAASYQYDKYVGAVYQLTSTYKAVPQGKLKQDVDSGKTVLAQDQFNYSTNDLYLTVTPGAEAPE